MIDKTRSMNDLLATLTESISTEDLLFANVASDIALVIISARMDAGLTQAEFAKKMGVSQAMISKWESGDYNHTIKSMIQIANKLGLVLDISMKKDAAMSNCTDNIIQLFPSSGWVSATSVNSTWDENLKEN